MAELDDLEMEEADTLLTAGTDAAPETNYDLPDIKNTKLPEQKQQES